VKQHLIEKRLSTLSLLPQTEGPQKLIEVVRSDLISCLSNYFVFEDSNALMKIDNEDGLITLKLMLKSDAIKPLNYLG